MKIKKSGICGSPDFLPFNFSNYYFVSTNYSIFSFLLQYVIILFAISSKGGEMIEAIITIDNDINITYTFTIYSNINMASHYHKFTSLILVKN